MITDTLIIAGFVALAVLLWATLPLLVPDRDEDAINFNWQGTVPAGPGLCSCGAPHAKLAPFPGDPVLLPAPVPVAGPMPEYAVAALGHDSVDDAVDSIFTRAMARQLAEQIRDGAL